MEGVLRFEAKCETGKAENPIFDAMGRTHLSSAVIRGSQLAQGGRVALGLLSSRVLSSTRLNGILAGLVVRVNVNC